MDDFEAYLPDMDVIAEDLPNKEHEFVQYRLRHKNMRFNFRTTSNFRFKGQRMSSRFSKKGASRVKQLPKGLQRIQSAYQALVEAHATTKQINDHLLHSFDLLDHVELNEIKNVLEETVLISPKESEIFDSFTELTIEMRQEGYAPFQSTAVHPNRRANRNRVEAEVALPEQGIDGIEIYEAKSDGEVLLATGYTRIVYGDHGPYLEFMKEQVVWDSFPHFKGKGHIGYYDEYHSEAGTKLYDQKMTVADQPNPPPDSEFSTNNNLREGYADYKPGMLYIGVFEAELKTKTYLSILLEKQGQLSNARRGGMDIQCIPAPELGEEAKAAMEEIKSGNYVPGLYLVEDFLTEEEERRVAQTIKKRRNQYFDRTQQQNKRRSGQFGWRLNYRTMELYRAKGIFKDIPADISWIRDKLHDTMEKLLLKNCKNFDQLILNEYYPTQAISRHIDRTHCFGPVVCGLSLFSPCVIIFSHKDSGEARPVLLPPRSMYVMSGQCRYKWFHEITKDAKQNFYDTVIQRGYRCSMTFRHAIKADSEVLTRSAYNAKSAKAMNRGKNGTKGDLEAQKDELERISNRRGNQNNRRGNQNNRNRRGNQNNQQRGSDGKSGNGPGKKKKRRKKKPSEPKKNNASAETSV